MDQDGDFTKLPYAKWLEDGIREIVSRDVSCISITALNEDGTSTIGYWNTSTEDKCAIATHMMLDAALDYVIENIDQVREALESSEDEA